MFNILKKNTVNNTIESIVEIIDSKMHALILDIDQKIGNRLISLENKLAILEKKIGKDGEKKKKK